MAYWSPRKKPFGAVDGVEGPVTGSHITIAVVNPVQYLGAGGGRQHLLHLVGHLISRARAMSGLRSSAASSSPTTGIIGKGRSQGFADHGLGAKVSHGDRTLVVLFDGLGHHHLPHGFTQFEPPG
jgi:hypothetical protein